MVFAVNYLAKFVFNNAFKLILETFTGSDFDDVCMKGVDICISMVAFFLLIFCN